MKCGDCTMYDTIQSSRSGTCYGQIESCDISPRRGCLPCVYPDELRECWQQLQCENEDEDEDEHGKGGK
jgi:hypothetical protein